MTFLLFLTAVLMAVSGGLKLRSTARVGQGSSILAIVEMLLALALALLIFPGPLSGTPWAPWVVLFALVVIVVSSVEHAFRVRAYRRSRAESEGGRLATYVEHLSDADEDDGEEPPSEGRR
ncbi:MAG: hypothetical protein R3304_02150 [Longimicrobiales bacterium]|nr:hypothetical protein [Longimicrobiales bacterium]